MIRKINSVWLERYDCAFHFFKFSWRRLHVNYITVPNHYPLGNMPALPSPPLRHFPIVIFYFIFVTMSDYVIVISE